MLTLLSWIGLIYAIYCGVLFLIQRQIMFPRAMVTAEGNADRSGGRSVWLSTSGGQVEAWFLPPLGDDAGDPAPVILFAHGNAEVIDDWPLAFEGFRKAGLAVLLVEYPGYGRSEGEPSQATITETMLAAFGWLLARPEEIDPTRIVFMGRSLGGGAVCQLAARRGPAALILTSTFTSARWFAKGYLAPSWLVRDPFDNLAVVSSLERPLLIVHGRRDELIPFHHAEILAAAAPMGRLLPLECGHNDCPPNEREFQAAVLDFLKTAGVLPSSPP